MNREEIVKLEEELRQAMLKSDSAKLDKLLADTLVFTLPMGVVIDKNADLEAHSSGLQKLVKLDCSDQDIKLYDSFAIVTVQAELEGTYGANPIGGTFRYTRVWSDVNGSLKVVAGHASEVV